MTTPVEDMPVTAIVAEAGIDSPPGAQVVETTNSLLPATQGGFEADDVRVPFEA